MEQKEVINYHVLELKAIEKLSERTKNICIDNSLDTLYKLLDYFFKYGSFSELKNCGTKSDIELTAMLNKYISKYEITPEMLLHEGHHRSFEEYKMYCFEQFRLSSRDAEAFRHAFVEERFPFFQFALLILKRTLSKREYFLFEHNFGYFTNKNKMTLQAVGNLYAITRERIRQVSHEIPYKIRDILSAFSKELFFINNHIRYNLKSQPDLIIIDEQTTAEINQVEELNCTSRFFALGFSILYQNNYYFFQEPDYHYQNYYLVDRSLASLFDFGEYYHTLYLIFLERRKSARATDLKEFLSPFYKIREIKQHQRIENLCKIIAKGEFGFTVTPNNVIEFPRNTHVKISEQILGILREAGRPMHLKEIAEKLRAKKPKQYPSIESLRSSVLTIDEVVAIGKTSTYSLKEWTHIKTSTIKELAREYLSDRDKPVHVSELSRHVNQYRKTQDKNVYANLKLDKTGSFVFFHGGFIGLASKKYHSGGSTFGQLDLL